ncbi:MAG: hypothetical protein JKX82_09125 [Oleispira sp.]|nr:hypothetical protein [Oleispira sp.]
MFIKLFLFIGSLSLIACSGNNSSKTTLPDNSLKRLSGVVNNSSVYGAAVTAFPVGNHGQFRVNNDNEYDATSLFSNGEGRYGMILDIDEEGAYVVIANAPNADTEAEVQADPANLQCQVVSGCLVDGNVIAFGSTYPMPANFQWKAAIEFISDGQFVVINPITEMATVLGLATYVNSSSDTEVSVGTIAARGYYSSYGISKSNSQTADLLGLTDVISIEPINLFALHNISVNNSTTLQDSIRYGALVAAWQELELNYNNSIADQAFNFQAEVVFEFINNQGQLYQAEPLDDQTLSMKAWYSAAVTNLIAARDYHASLARSVPNEVNLVIARFQQEIAGFQNGVLTSAQPRIGEQLVADYTDAVAKSKAMVNYMSDLRNNFADEEYRSSVQASSTLATDEVRRLAPKFDILMQQLLSIHEYYLSCTHQVCNVGSPWHIAGNTYDAGNKKLTIVQSADTKLELTQAKVFSDDEPEGSAETHTHELLMAGAIEFEGLRVEFSDLSAEDASVIKSSIGFSYSIALAELPQLPDYIDNGKGARVDETLVADAIALTLPSFKLYDRFTVATERELTFSGALTSVMVANVAAEDFLEGLDEKDKLGKRYNLLSVSANLELSGVSQGVLEDATELRDSAIISFRAVASEAIVNVDNFSAYFPDTVYPTFDSFFNPREGFSIGDESPATMVVSRRGVMNFPRLDSDGNADENSGDIEVPYLELDYEVGGLERYVAYPKIGQDETYWGLLCSAIPEDEKDLIGPDWTIVDTDSDGVETTRVLLTCNIRQKFSGEATPDSLINSIYAINKDLVNLREYNGQGTYRIDYDTVPDGTDDDGNEIRVLSAFSQGEDTHKGVIEETIVLGVDSMRLQFQPTFVNDAATGFLPETVFDLTLVWRRHDLIDVNVFLSYNALENYANPNGSGLPYLGVGSDVESFSVAYRTDAAGTEVGEFAFAWSGIQFVDGPIDGEKVMQRTSDESLKEGFIAGIGSNVEYRDYTPREKETLGLADDTQITKEKCGFFDRGQETDPGQNCAAIAYLTFRGLVTGVLREESDGAYVIRYIDGSWQVLGVK